MKLPIDFKLVNDFISNNNLFSTTRENLICCLKNWWNDNNIAFLDDMNADLKTVLESYSFENNSISFNKSYSYEPPLDYISVGIRIYDIEGEYIGEYRAFYDLNLQIFDDKMR